jgi:hypothetical protein
MNFEQLTENKILEIGSVFEKNGVKGEVVEKKSIHQFSREILVSFENDKREYVNKNIDTA